MAKTTPPREPQATEVFEPAPAAQSTATPDNTPIPGGGSWHWDIAGLGWVENAPNPITPNQE